MTIDIDRLRAVAEAATDGPWEVASTSGMGYAVHRGEHDTIALYARRDDARHIATFDPQTMLELLAEIERLRGVVERVEVLADEWDYSRSYSHDDDLYSGRLRAALEGGE